MKVRVLCVLTSLASLLAASDAIATPLGSTATGTRPAAQTRRPVGRVVRLQRPGPRGTVQHEWFRVRGGGHAVAMIPGLSSEEIQLGNRIAYPPHRDGSPATFLTDVRAGLAGSRQIERARTAQREEHYAVRDHATWTRYVHTRNEALDHDSNRNTHVNRFQAYVSAARGFIAQHPEYADRRLPAPSVLRAEMTRAAGGRPVRDGRLTRLELTYRALADSAAEIR